jgi:hypothetical protein
VVGVQRRGNEFVLCQIANAYLGVFSDGMRDNFEIVFTELEQVRDMRFL